MLEDDVLGNLYKKFPVTIEKGLGSHVWDIDGNEYIDCMGSYGVAIVGYQNQRVNDAIKNQIGKIIHLFLRISLCFPRFYPGFGPCDLEVRIPPCFPRF